MADVKLTKYIDGAGIQALYKSIRKKVTGSDAAVTGDWYAGAMKIETNQPMANESTYHLVFWDSSGYNFQDVKNTHVTKTPRSYPDFYITNGGDVDTGVHTLFVPKLNITTATGLSITGGDKNKVLLGDGTSKVISELEVKSATSATQIKSELATSSTNPTYYLLGSRLATADASTPLKHANVSVTVGGDSKAILSADGFNGPVYVELGQGDLLDSNTSKQYLWVSPGETVGYSSPRKNTGLYYNYAMDVIGQAPVHGLHADQFVGAFVGDLKGNADSATNASKVNITNNDNESIYLLGSKDAGYADVYRNSKIYVRENQLFLPTIPTEDNAAATKKYVDDKVKNFDEVNNVLKFKGTIDSENAERLLLAEGIIGEVYIARASGNYAGVEFEVGDMAIITKSHTTDPKTNAEFMVIQRNIPGVLDADDITSLLQTADGQPA